MEHMQGREEGKLHENLLYGNKGAGKKKSSVSKVFLLQLWILILHHSLCFWFFSSLWTSYCWSLLAFSPFFFWVQSLKPLSTCETGEIDGTESSAEMMWNSPLYSGTEKIPECCFGNSGVSWSAGEKENGNRGMKTSLLGPCSAGNFQPLWS